MYFRFFKRPLDMILSIILIFLFIPLLFIVSLIIFIKMGYPIFFVQRRPGKDSKGFKMLKFRSMSNTRGKDGKLLSDKKRLSKFGIILRKTSIDELPELFNVLKGEMSLVGPRPQLFRDLIFMTEKQKKRQKVLPGLTGLAQVNGRNGISWEKKIFYDLEYLKKITFIGDVKIIFKTIFVVLKRKNIDTSQNSPSLDLGESLLFDGVISKKQYLDVLKKYNDCSGDVVS